jgi:hypothetical protein
MWPILIQSILISTIKIHHLHCSSFLVIFGGASPEEGPMGDTVFAELPCSSLIGEIAVTITVTMTPQTLDLVPDICP